MASKTDSQASGGKVARFKTFPEFSKLTIANKKEYEALISDYPPIYDLSFSSLMTWWNPLNSMCVAQLNDNLVMPYWLPGEGVHSGLSFIGTNKVDESLCVIFDYQQSKGEVPRLINVPEFVINSIQYPD